MTTHGLRSHRLWPIYCAMIRRCSVKASPKDRTRYLDRGIRVCKQWRKSFPQFAKWAFANGYADHLELDRQDRDGDYSPDNCRWVTESVQAQNRSKRSDKTSSKYKGVCFFKHQKKWKGSIMLRGKSYHLGYFKEEKEAARAYDMHAVEMFGENAVLNFPERIKKKKK